MSDSDKRAMNELLCLFIRFKIIIAILDKSKVGRHACSEITDLIK